jgi:hypothetical protein
MIGIIQKVLLSLLDELGEELGDARLRARVLERAGLATQTRFRINANYPDDDVLALIEATVAESGLGRRALMDRYAQGFIRYAEQLFPRFFILAGSAHDFMLRQPTIHSSFATGLRTPEERSAVEDKFRLRERADGSLEVSYHSNNRLCDLYAALAVALGERYREVIAVETLRCGADAGGADCLLRVYWVDQQAPSSDACTCQRQDTA